MVSKPPDLIGQTVEDRFEILSLIGEGGVAYVFKARLQDHAKSRGQGEKLVAIKVLKRYEQYSSVDIERLKREAVALQTLSHPNIVRAYSFGFLKSNEPYLVLDFLSGRSLEDCIYKYDVGFDLSWMVQIFLQICRGLSCAHSNELIHRDLKPSNIMILDESKDGNFVKLLDFGTAKSTVSKPNELQLTKKGIVFGSPYYISPELVSGKPFDTRADIYSLGCLMYEALTKQVPHKGKNEMETLMKHIHEIPKSFSQIQMQHKIPVALEELIFRCMAKDPSLRFSKAIDIESSLDKILDLIE